jgi:hypothetical protein
MFGSSLRARFLPVVSLAALVLLPCANAAPAAAKKTFKPSERIRTIKVGGFGPGHQSKQSSVVPLDRLPSFGGGTVDSGSSFSAASSSQSSGSPLFLNLPGLNVYDGPKPPPFNEQYDVSDATGAIGPNHYVEMVNSAIAVYDRQTLNLISQARLPTQFTNLQTPEYVGEKFFVDPQIKWDEQGQRWLYAGLGPQLSSTPQRVLLFGWSMTSDPSDVDGSDGVSGWCHYTVTPPAPQPPEPGLRFDDYPKLGHSDNHIIIGTNMRVGAGDARRRSRIWAIPKPAPGVTTCPTDAPTASTFGSHANPLQTKDPHNAFTPVPASTLESTDKGYIVAADYPDPYAANGTPEAAADELQVWHIQGPPNDPDLVEDENIGVSSYEHPRNAPQPEWTPGIHDPIGLSALEGIGARLTAAVVASDPDEGGAKAIWTQHAIDGPGERSQARWYELVPGRTPPLRQEGTIASPVHWVFNPAISPTKAGNEAVINYNLASSTQVPQVAARLRRSGTPLGEMSEETMVGTSDAFLYCEGTCQWGDYSGASPDPSNVHAVWGSNQLAGPNEAPAKARWTTRNFAALVSHMATFEDGQVVSPLTGFDSAVGSFEVKGTTDSPGPYEGTKFLRAIHWPQIGPAQGRFSRKLPNGSDVWYGAAFYIDNAFKGAADNVAMLEWRDPVSDVHGGLSLRSDDKYHVVRGSTASPTADINVGPEFDLPQNRYIWLEVHQRLDTVNALTEVFLDGRLIMTTAAQNTYHDSIGIPTRVSYGIGTVSSNAFQLYLDRASLGDRQVGAVGAPATPTGFTGSGQDRTTIMYWNPVPGAIGYRVYKQAADGTWFQRFDTTTTAVFESGLTNCTTYRYRVSAYDSTGLESVVSEPLALTPKAPNQQC